MKGSTVEMMAYFNDDEDCAFDQSCKHGHRVGGHAVYCHNKIWDKAPMKCRNTWAGYGNDEDCPGYVPNDLMHVVGSK